LGRGGKEGLIMKLFELSRKHITRARTREKDVENVKKWTDSRKISGENIREDLTNHLNSLYMLCHNSTLNDFHNLSQLIFPGLLFTCLIL
jgi:hypothetical protein